ncbi:ABC transporter permease subunit [Falsibacillus albus]|uniref:ABC transporter permease n=1 Tax=Falsibacillus albus TaxID=2478915 RepID=A0A3L7JVT2_9BACI|nr:ABC transporter permease subunit [Falsibacillus albus]RLQ93771.1 ABC transporter permease [Falsibacillus albus]
MNIYIHELKAYRKSTMLWTALLVFLLILFMSLFPSIAHDFDEFKKILEGFPEGVRKAIGLQVESMGTVVGFYSYTFLYLTLCGAIQGMNFGISIVSKETREKTADFLLTKPVTRKKVLSSKILAAITSLIVTNVIFIIAAVLLANLVKTEAYSLKIFLMISLTLFFIQMIFFSMGILIAVVFSKIKSVITVSLGVVFMFFMVGLLAAVGGEDGGHYFSPFKYFDTAYIIRNSSYEPSYALVGTGVIIVSLAASYLIYTKKDIHSV